MSLVRIAVCAAAVVSASVVFAARDRAVGEPGLASQWVQLHNARVRLVAGPSGAKPAKSYVAGLEVALADGWKTYWRMPGDAGVPPLFDWTGSGNVAATKVLYPAPVRMIEPGAESVGYKSSVLFPVEVVPKDSSRPVDLKLLLEFGVCRDICIPAQATLSLDLAPAALAGEPAAAILAALERVPRAAAARRPTDPEMKQVTASLDGAAPKLLIEARFARGDRSADLFIEAPDGLYVPMSKRLADAADGTARFEVDLSRGGNAAEFKGKTLTLTLVSDTGATEASWKLP